MGKWENLLEEEIVDEITRLGQIDLGGQEYKTTVDGVTRLMDRAIEIHKLKTEAEEQARKREAAEAQANFDHEMKRREVEVAEAQVELDKRLKPKQQDEERWDRLIKNIITGVSVGAGIVLTVWGTNKTLKFEETGTITTTAGRKHINKLFSWLR